MTVVCCGPQARQKVLVGVHREPGVASPESFGYGLDGDAGGARVEVAPLEVGDLTAVESGVGYEVQRWEQSMMPDAGEVATSTWWPRWGPVPAGSSRQGSRS